MQWIVRLRRFVPLCGMALIVAVAATACGGRSRRHVTISVDRPSALLDVPVAVVVRGLRPREVVDVRASAVLLARQSTSSARFAADGHGTVDLTTAQPMAGSSYEAVDGMGLFWSLADQRPAPRPGTSDRYTVTLIANVGGHQLARRDVTRLAAAPGQQTRTETVGADGFEGVFYAASGTTHRPAVVVFGGSEGGFGPSRAFASMLAAHGYPALAVAYFGLPGLPPTLSGIPLEYFAKAAGWLARQPEVDPSKIWLLSASRGSEAALLAGAHFGDLVHGVIVAAPSSVAFTGMGGAPAWTLHDEPVASTAPDLAQAARGATGLVDRPAFLAGLSGPASKDAAIPVEEIRGPILTMAGVDDQLWPSALFAERIHTRLAAHQFAFAHDNLIYPGAGHTVFSVPYTPVGPGFAPFGNVTLVLGGTPAANEAAHLDDWPKVLAFIAQH